MYVPLECHRNSYLSTAQIALGAWDTEIWPSGSGWCVCVWGGGLNLQSLLFHQGTLEAGTLLMSYD